MKLISVPINQLKPRKNNPRLHQDDDVDGIVASIKEFGFQTPLLVERKTMKIIAGHGRYAAAKKLGLESVPCVMSDLEGDKAAGYVIADNATAELSTWDWPVLQKEIQALQSTGFDITRLGFEEHDLGTILAGEWKMPDLGEMPQPDDKPVVFHVTQEQAVVIERAILKLQEEVREGAAPLSKGRAIELICADYLSGK